MRGIKLVLWVLAGVLVVAIAAVVALMSVDPTVFRSQLEAAAEAGWGRRVQFAGPISLELSLHPDIVLRDVSIGNPDWASQPDMLTVEQIDVQVRLLPLIMGDLEMVSLAFSGVHVVLEEGPGGVNNYTFGEPGEQAALPDVKRLFIKDSILERRPAEGTSSRYEITNAHILNVPGQPEEVDAEGFIRGLPFTAHFISDQPAETSNRANPWNVNLEISGAGMLASLEGRVAAPPSWKQVEYRIHITGEETDSLEKLLRVELPKVASYEFAADVNADQNVYEWTQMSALVTGLADFPDIKVSTGKASAGVDTPTAISLEGELGGTPLSLVLDADEATALASLTEPWAMEASVHTQDAELELTGTLANTSDGVALDFDARIAGESLGSLSPLIGVALPDTEPFEMASAVKVVDGSYLFSDLRGHVSVPEWLGDVRIKNGEVAVGSREPRDVTLDRFTAKKGDVKVPEWDGRIGEREVAVASGEPLNISLEGLLESGPFTLSLQSSSATASSAGATHRPLALRVTVAGATLAADGALLSSPSGKGVELQVELEGEELAALGPLAGVAVPALGKYQLAGQIKSAEGVHAITGLQAQIGNHDLSGDVTWESKAPRPLLTGQLSSNRLDPTVLLAAPSADAEKSAWRDRPVNTDLLNTIDTNIELRVQELAGAPISVRDVVLMPQIEEGQLKLPFRATLARTAVDGQLEMAKGETTPAVALTAKASGVDMPETLERYGSALDLSGTIDELVFNGTSQGETLGALLDNATVNVTAEPANVGYAGQILDLAFDLIVEAMQIDASPGKPVTLTANGMAEGAPFNFTFEADTLGNVLTTRGPWQMRAAFDASDVDFSAEGSIAEPWAADGFDFEYEIEGEQVATIQAAFDFVLPLRGPFLIKGHFTEDKDVFTTDETWEIGKSRFKTTTRAALKDGRFEGRAEMVAEELHFADVDLLEEAESPKEERQYLIPDQALPVDMLNGFDFVFNFRANRVVAGDTELGDLVFEANLENGRFLLSPLIAIGTQGSRISGTLEVDMSVEPPTRHVQLTIKDLDYGLLLEEKGLTDMVEGQIDLTLDLSGPGETRRAFLSQADGHLELSGDEGRFASRRLDLWAADFITTMLSPQWLSEDVTELNCVRARVDVEQGQAEIRYFVIDTTRITIAGSGILDLGTEELDVVIAPSPKQPSLVSLANPVEISGTLSELEVKTTTLPIPNRTRMAGVGLLAGLINPAFLVLAFADLGTGEADPCQAAVEAYAENADNTDRSTNASEPSKDDGAKQNVSTPGRSAQSER